MQYLPLMQLRTLGQLWQSLTILLVALIIVGDYLVLGRLVAVDGERVNYLVVCLLAHGGYDILVVLCRRHLSYEEPCQTQGAACDDDLANECR